MGSEMCIRDRPLIIRPEDSPIPTFDTTALHALAAVEFSLAN